MGADFARETAQILATFDLLIDAGRNLIVA